MTELVGRLARHGEVAVYGVLTVVAAAAVAAAVGYGVLVDGNRVGPGLLPFVAGTVVSLCCGTALVKAVRGAGAEHEAGEAGTAAGDGVDIFGRTSEWRVRMVWIVFGLLLATLLLVHVAGFLVAFGLFMIVVSSAVEGRPLLRATLIAVVAAAAVYALFVEFLAVPLPGGILGLG